MEEVNRNGTFESSQGKPLMLSRCTITFNNHIFLRDRGFWQSILVLTVSANGQWRFTNCCSESYQNGRERCAASISPR
jgi:hypothetical protein